MRTASVLAAAVTIGSLAGAALPAHAVTPPLKIYRLLGNPVGDDLPITNTKLNNEWVQITNTTSYTRAVAGVRISDREGHVFVFPTGYTIAPHATVTVRTGSGTNTSTSVYWKQGNYVWNNTGDIVYLRNSAGTLVHSCTWNGSGTGRYC